MRENIIFYAGSQLKCWSQCMLNGGNSGQTVLICSLINHYFPVWHYIRVDSTVASLKSRLIIIISVDRDMRCVDIILN